MIAQATEVSTL